MRGEVYLNVIRLEDDLHVTAARVTASAALPINEPSSRGADP